jgi:hypothetical protein
MNTVFRSHILSCTLVQRAFVLLALTVNLMACQETVDNIDSRVACREYCAKRFACADQNPTNEESSDCTRACRSNIEDDCGNEHQAAANDAIHRCVDLSCVEFGACMVFEAAQECFAFARD